MELFKKELFEAVKNGQIETVKILLSQGVDVNSKTSDGETPLHLAIQAFNDKMIQFLIDQGADVSMKNGAGETPMQWAMTKYTYKMRIEYENLLKSLLEAGADVNSRGSSYTLMTPLLCAAEICAPKLAKYLVDKGADVHAKDGYGRGALSVAAYRCGEYPQQTAMLLEVLLDANANPNEKDRHYDTALHILVRSIDGGKQPAPIRREQISKIMKLFFKHGADFNATDDDGRTPMDFICTPRAYRKMYEDSLHLDLIESLILDGGVDVNSKITRRGDLDDYSREGMSLLHRACEELSLPLVKFLLKNGADLESKTEEGDTPLLFAIKNCSYNGVDRSANSLLDLVKYLLKKGANICNVRSPDNEDEDEDEDQAENILDFLNYAYLPDIPVEKTWRKIILEHIAKELCLERSVDSHLLATIARDSKYSDYLDKCFLELASLNETKFIDSWLTPGDLLIKDKKSLALYAENSSLVSKFLEIDLEEMFPIYGPAIKLRIQKAMYHQKIIKSAALALTSSLAYPLPYDHLVIRGIFQYCSIKDLKNLALASSSETSLNQEPC